MSEFELIGLFWNGIIAGVAGYDMLKIYQYGYNKSDEMVFCPKIENEHRNRINFSQCSSCKFLNHEEIVWNLDGNKYAGCGFRENITHTTEMESFKELLKEQRIE